MESTPHRARVRRGTLSREHIVATALRLAGAEPAVPITMERVATALGTRPMSLYTHVRNRDELLSLAAHEAWRTWEVGVAEHGPWDERLRSWCRSLRDHVSAYPQLTEAMTNQGTFEPGLLAAVAALARVLGEAGLGGADLVAAIRWVPQTVLGAVVLELSRPDTLVTPQHEAAAILGSLAALDPADRAELEDLLPHFAADPTDLFDYSVERIVDGIAAVAGR